MSVVDLGSTKCNSSDVSKILPWFFPFSWDDGQNCLPGCISRMNENKWEVACCQATQGNNKRGTHCMVRDKSDVVQGDDDSTDTKAVKCQGTSELF